MCTRSARHRHTAYLKQSGRCYYCGLPMWEDAAEAFAKRHRLQMEQALQRQSTAEHLKARVDGGRNAKGNIVAACLQCNQSRHLNGEALDPASYKQKVRALRGKSGDFMQRGKRLMALLLLSTRLRLPKR